MTNKEKYFLVKQAQATPTEPTSAQESGGWLGSLATLLAAGAGPALGGYHAPKGKFGPGVVRGGGIGFSTLGGGLLGNVFGGGAGYLGSKLFGASPRSTDLALSLGQLFGTAAGGYGGYKYSKKELWPREWTEDNEKAKNEEKEKIRKLEEKKKKLK